MTGAVLRQSPTAGHLGVDNESVADPYHDERMCLSGQLVVSAFGLVLVALELIGTAGPTSRPSRCFESHRSHMSVRRGRSGRAAIRRK